MVLSLLLATLRSLVTQRGVYIAISAIAFVHHVLFIVNSVAWALAVE